MSKTLYRKYRPTKFTEVIGQDNIVQTLSNAVKNGRIGQAYLFTGPRGTGKTTLARILAKAANCLENKNGNPCGKCKNCQNIGQGNSLDIFEIDAASNTGVDNIRELRETIKLPPTSLEYKIYIIDEVHMLSTGAFNALLKTLEEPPSHVIFILATTEIHKVPDTIISRCQRFDFSRISLKKIAEKLSKIAENEGVAIESAALEIIAISSEGGMRDAESLLSQIISLEDKKITAKEVQEILGTTGLELIEKMASLIAKNDTNSSLHLLNEIVQKGYDLEIFHRSLMNYFRQMLLVSIDEELLKTFTFELSSEQLSKLNEVTKKTSTKELLFSIETMSQAKAAIKNSFIPQLPIEIALVKITQREKLAQNTEKKSNSEEKKTEKNNTEEDLTIKKQENINEDENINTTDEDNSNDSIGKADISEYEIKKNWKKITEEVSRENHSLATVFPNCMFVRSEGQNLIIATKYSFYKDKLSEMSNKLTVEAAFDKILGFKARVKILTEEEAGVKIPSNTSTVEKQGEEKPKETSPLLSEAMDMLGGEISEEN